jgi:hypothetical protein
MLKMKERQLCIQKSSTVILLKLAGNSTFFLKFFNFSLPPFPTVQLPSADAYTETTIDRNQSLQYNDIQLNVAALCQCVICLQKLAFFTGAAHPFFWLAVNVYTVRLIYEIPFRFHFPAVGSSI